MKRIVLTAGVLTAALALAACGQKTETAQAPAAAPEPAAAPAATPATDNMAGMNMAAEGAKMAKGMGTVTAIDTTAGTITVEHGPIPEANWPAMTTGFKAAPSLAQSVKAGDKVAFDLKLENGGGEITAIQKQ
ncbi:copper-binding protein [Phenylobacterium sp.]|uniref:copper-binding protein n=1 Tax=Phenylobacterium sp. TaxID=1871053 RepID=UPI0035B000BD